MAISVKMILIFVYLVLGFSSIGFSQQILGPVQLEVPPFEKDKEGKNLILDYSIKRFLVDIKQNFEAKKIKKYIRYFVYILHVRKYHLKIMKSVDLVISHAHHHSRWLASKSVTVQYVPLPVADTGKIFFSKNINRPLGTSGKIIFGLIGASQAIATLTGLIDFLNNILPGLDSIKSKIEFHLFGKHSNLNPRLKTIIDNHNNVIIKGYVENIEDIFYNIDCMYVPTPFTLGFRTRIAEAFSFGSLVLCHSGNLKGMPELSPGNNILVADNANSFLKALEIIESKPKTTDALRKQARETYAAQYNIDVTCQQFLGYINNIKS